MKSLKEILMEDYNAPGKFVLPPNHKAGMKVPKGGSCCANCRFFKEDNICMNKYYRQWAQTDVIPMEPYEYCSDWWEPKK